MPKSPPFPEARAAFDRLLKHARWVGLDAFGHHRYWNDAHIAWLHVAHKVGRLAEFENRITKSTPAQRNEAFAELAAAWAFENLAGGVISDWGPNNARGEFSLSVNGEILFSEVKSPGWEGEIVKERGRKRASQRLRQPKFIEEMEVFRPMTDPIIYHVINKARAKFPAGVVGIVIFVDDFMDTLLDDTDSVWKALFQDRSKSSNGRRQRLGYFTRPRSKWLAGAAFLEATCFGREISYRLRVIPNPKSPFAARVTAALKPWVPADFQDTGEWGDGLHPG